MNLTQLLFRYVVLTGLLTTLLLSGIEFPLGFSKASAQRFGRPPSANKPGGKRSPCPTAVPEKVLTALVEDSAYTQPLLTTQEHPTFLFYVPFSRTWEIDSDDGQSYNITSAEFELLDENENPVLKNQKIIFSLPENPGLVKVTLPITETELEPDKEYFWIFRVICDANDNTANPSVAGWIKRVRGDSNPNLWFDRLEQLAQSPTTYLEQWRQLLVEVDPELQNLAQTPIVELEPEASGTRRQEDNGCYYNQLPTRTYGAQ